MFVDRRLLSINTNGVYIVLEVAMKIGRSQLYFVFFLIYSFLEMSYRISLKNDNPAIVPDTENASDASLAPGENRTIL